MYLDKPRIEKIISSISENKIAKRFLRNFFSVAETSRTFEALGKTHDYICYVLKSQIQHDQNSEIIKSK